MKNNVLLLISAFIIGMYACKRQSNDMPEKNDTVPSHSVLLTSEQLRYAEIETGRIEKHILSDVIKCNGSIEANPNDQALVNAPMKGYVKKILVHIGDFVQRGSTLAILEHAEYIKLQQEFLEVKSQYDYYKEEFKRQGELTLENATSVKLMQQAQNEFRKTEVHLYALKKQLSLLGIQADSLTVDNLVSKIELTSPVQGYITAVNCQIGMLCSEDIPIFEVVGKRNPILHLKVYEKDAIHIAKEQHIDFSLISQSDRIYKAKVRAVTRSIDKNNSINLHADILTDSENIMPGMYVSARIYVNSDSVYSINTEAIVNSEGNQYLFVKIDSTQFKPFEIKTGRKSDNRSEILSMTPELKDSEIVVSGAYYLFSELFKEE